jgi:hypothetical protein
MVVGMLGGLASETSGNSTIHFWLSNGDFGPTVPVLFVPPNSSGQIDLWARPHAGHRIDGFSLDLVSTDANRVQLESIDIFNPVLQPLPFLARHQVVFDSSSGLFAEPDLIGNFMAFSFFNDVLGLSNGAGMGPACGLDPECSGASGVDSWRVATASFTTGAESGATELYLQIGEQGLWQSPWDAIELAAPTDTSALFGLPGDALNHWSVPSIGGVDHRHQAQGVADALVVIATADFNQDGFVDGADFLIWQQWVGMGATLAEGDADGDSDVDQVDLAAWQYQFGSLAASLAAGSPVPEPASCFVAWLAMLCQRRRGRQLSARDRS